MVRRIKQRIDDLPASFYHDTREALLFLQPRKNRTPVEAHPAARPRRLRRELDVLAAVFLQDAPRGRWDVLCRGDDKRCEAGAAAARLEDLVRGRGRPAQVRIDDDGPRLLVLRAGDAAVERGVVGEQRGDADEDGVVAGAQVVRHGLGLGPGEPRAHARRER